MKLKTFISVVLLHACFPVNKLNPAGIRAFKLTIQARTAFA
jgi:hypothetical protein